MWCVCISTQASHLSTNIFCINPFPWLLQTETLNAYHCCSCIAMDKHTIQSTPATWLTPNAVDLRAALYYYTAARVQGHYKLVSTINQLNTSKRINLGRAVGGGKRLQGAGLPRDSTSPQVWRAWEECNLFILCVNRDWIPGTWDLSCKSLGPTVKSWGKFKAVSPVQ